MTKETPLHGEIRIVPGINGGLSLIDYRNGLWLYKGLDDCLPHLRQLFGSKETRHAAQAATFSAAVSSMLIEHKGNASYRCGVCDAPVKSIEAWKIHALTHPDMEQVHFFGNNKARKPMGLMFNPKIPTLHL